MANTAIDTEEGSLFKKIVLYSIPLVFSGVLQLLFNAADLVIVGRYCGHIYVGAVGATSSLIHLIVGLFMGLSVGAGVRVAHGIGANDTEEIHKTVHTAVPAAIICGIILTVIGVLFSTNFLQLMETPDEVLPLSSLYMRIYFLGITANMIYNFGAAILRAAGNTRGPLYYLTAAGVLNVILNVIFVKVFDMNVDGVAWATAISQCLSAALVIISLMRRDDACRFELRKMKIYKDTLVRILEIGVPAGIQGSLFSISNVIIQSSVNSFGDMAVSGSSAASNIDGFVFVAMNALHQAAMNFVGVYYGAKKYDQIGKIMRICLISVFVVGAVLGGGVYLFAPQLLSIYITDSAAAIGYGIIRMKYVCLFEALDGMMDVMTGVLRGMGSSVAPMIITVLGVCVFRVTWVYTVFRMFNSFEALLVSYPISWILTFSVEFIVYIMIRKKQMALPEGN